MEIYFATGNAHKARELQDILASHIIKTPADLGLPFEIDETGTTFLENALLKARALKALLTRTGLPNAAVIADDSGLAIDALDGRPGIHSARYGAANGAKLDTPQRNALLLQEYRSAIHANPAAPHNARFVCAMVLLLTETRLYAAQETLEGQITETPSGSSGFGYDPILYLPEKGCTVADLPESEKNTLSHRGKAARVIAKILS
jgi:XTP/dITP diphosphohydrolase